MANNETQEQRHGNVDEQELMSRREYLISLKKWSKAVIGGVIFGGVLTGIHEKTSEAASWVNRRGNWGNGWNNRGSGDWYNSHGGWRNSGKWSNHNPGGSWANKSGGGWNNRGGSWVNTGGGGWINRR